MRKWLAPKSSERRYGRVMRATVAELKAEFLRRLGELPKFKPFIVGIEPNDELQIPITLKKESDDISALIFGMLAWWQIRQTDHIVTVRELFNTVNAFNDDQFRAVVKSLVKIDLPPSQSRPYVFGQNVSSVPDLINKLGDTADIFRQEPYIDGVKTNWEETQSTYLDKTVKSTLWDAELILRNALVSASVLANVANVLTGKFNKVSNSANRFAEDEINKLNGRLTEDRAKSVGSDSYIWNTQRDERVRGDPTGLYPNSVPSHYARDNEIFNWGNPPEGGHPGEAYGCRCYATINLAK